MEMKFNNSSFLWLLMIQSLVVLGVSQDRDFFYLVQQWPGSSGGTHNICYPTTGKPAQSFIVSGFWPSFNNGSIPTYCDPNNPFNETKFAIRWRGGDTMIRTMFTNLIPAKVAKIIDYLQTDWPSLACPSSNSTQLWADEWEMHGTCSQSVFDQYSYFNHATGLKEILRDILIFLEAYGIRPDGKAYKLNSLMKYLKSAFLGRNVGIECNEDASAGNSQFYQVYICIEPHGKFVIDCPVLPVSKCADSVVFPSF